MIVGKAYRTQGGLPKRFRKATHEPNGLLLKGVVIATYVTDSNEHPKITDLIDTPIAVYCDLLVYDGPSYNRWFTLPKVLVSQKRGGLHDDDIWKPRATSKNILGDLNDTTGANPGSFDGDHVLVGFMNNSFMEPIILRGIPHPSRDIANELYGVGKRIKLKEVDGDPDFIKHHGVFRGVDDKGNFIVDSSFGNDGSTLEGGIEPVTDITGESGNQSFILPKDAVYSVVLQDMTSPLSPVEKIRLEIKNTDGNLYFSVNGGDTIKIDNKDALATLKLGNGSVSATVAEVLNTMWTNLLLSLSTHTHDETGTVTDIPIFADPLPTWDSNATSDKLTFPANSS